MNKNKLKKIIEENTDELPLIFNQMKILGKEEKQLSKFIYSPIHNGMSTTTFFHKHIIRLL